ncbi:5-formyltetrahydrofolate cyclo-ligase [Roseococcus sp.]|uniref:5-formyltetrahydrofolate cyclo-ligase n=1 Tax=Roseococcus sp. TaxID=2109646 RepID=UPI003BAB8088
MTKPPNPPEFHDYASPACFLHEVDPDYLGYPPEPDAEQRRDVARWRKAERERLIALRLAVDPQTRRQESEAIAAGLDAALGEVAGRIVSAYWPFRGEPDLRPWLERIHARGGRCALPVVVEKARPLVFREWTPGAALARGVWNIPIPAEGAEVVPEIVIAPVVGFDPGAYRLGYGGGFFDRTLAAMAVRPRVLGVGASRAAISTIFPQPHDIPMDAIVTERDILPRPS